MFLVKVQSLLVMVESPGVEEACVLAIEAGEVRPFAFKKVCVPACVGVVVASRVVFGFRSIQGDS